MRIAEKLISAGVVGLLVAVLALIFQLAASSAVANYDGSVQRDLSLAVPLLIGTLAGAGAFVFQWNGRSRRRRHRRV